MYPFLPTVSCILFHPYLEIALLTQFSFGLSISLSTLFSPHVPPECPGRINGVLTGIKTLGSQVFSPIVCGNVVVQYCRCEDNVGLLLFESHRLHLCEPV